MITETESFLQVIKSIADPFNLREVSQVLSENLLSVADAEVCELALLDEDQFFSRIHMALRSSSNVIHDQERLGDKFSFKRDHFDSSLQGHSLKTKFPYIWCESSNENFESFAANGAVPINRDSALQYHAALPGGVRNFAIIPFWGPAQPDPQAAYSVSGALTLINLCDGVTDEVPLDERARQVIELIELLSPHLYSAIFYKRVNDEIRIDEQVVEVTTETSVEKIFSTLVRQFNETLDAPLATVWFLDHDHKWLILHSVHANDQRVRDLVKNKGQAILDVDESLIGVFEKDRDRPWLKKFNLGRSEEASAKYQWHEVSGGIGTNQLVAFPIRDSAQLIAVMVFHPRLERAQFDRLNMQYMASLASQVVPVLKYRTEWKFAKKATQLSKKLQSLAKEKSEIFLQRLVSLVRDVIGAEACSIFEARGGPWRGVYLLASTDTKGAEAQQAPKTYEIDNESITGYVAAAGKSVIVYDVDDVQRFVPEINQRSLAFVEQTKRPHKSYIGVPIPSGKQSFKDPRTSILVIRCINKTATPDARLTAHFSDYDRRLLEYVGLVISGVRQLMRTLSDRNEMLDLLVHEIEAPIVSICNKMELLLDDASTANLDKISLTQKLEDISDMAQFLSHWAGNVESLNEFLQGREISAGRSRTRLWNEVIEHVVYSMTQELKSHGLSPWKVMQKCADQEYIINIDRDHFRQVFFNLLTNAIKYRDRGTPRVKISFEVEWDYDLTIRVLDWGVGIPEDESAEVFAIGCRGSYAEDNEIRGKGFGLWLSQQLLHSNDCTITLSGTQGPTSFEIVIPREYVVGAVSLTPRGRSS